MDEQRVFVFVCQDGSTHLVSVPGYWWYSSSRGGSRHARGRLFFLLIMDREDEQRPPTISGFQRDSEPLDLEGDDVPMEVLTRHLYLENRDEESETTPPVRAVFATVEVAEPRPDDERAYLVLTEHGRVWRREGGLARDVYSKREWPAAVLGLDEEAGAAAWLRIENEGGTS